MGASSSSYLTVYVLIMMILSMKFRSLLIQILFELFILFICTVKWGKMRSYHKTTVSNTALICFPVMFTRLGSSAYNRNTYGKSVNSHGRHPVQKKYAIPSWGRNQLV